LPDDARAALRDGAVLRDYPRSTPLFNTNDAATHFLIILNGWVKLSRVTAEGEESVMGLYTRGDYYGESAICSGGQYDGTAETIEDSRIFEIPAQSLKKAAHDFPVIMTRLMAAMAREMHKLQMEYEHIAIMSAPQRVGCLLLQLSAGMAGKGGTFSFPYDKALAAARLGITPETFSRALTQLKPQGVSVKGPEVTIESFTCLSAYCCGHCSAGDTPCRHTCGH
jgi:CRP-like cAMP-binding protein